MFRTVLIGMKLMFWVLRLIGLGAAMMARRETYIPVSWYVWLTLQSELASRNVSGRLLIDPIEIVLRMSGIIPDSSYLYVQALVKPSAICSRNA